MTQKLVGVRIPKEIVDEWNVMFPGRKKPQIIRTLNDVFKIVTKNDEIFKKQKRRKY